jgi:hypothetical protein
VPELRRMHKKLARSVPREFTFFLFGYIADVAGEIQLLTCGYSAQCTVRGCGAPATTIARMT